MNLKLSPEFYNKVRTLTCPKCKHSVEFKFKELNSEIKCKNCGVSIFLKDSMTAELKKM